MASYVCFVSLGWVVNLLFLFFFLFNDTATTEIYTLSLHDALPIWSYFYVFPNSIAVFSYQHMIGKHSAKWNIFQTDRIQLRLLGSLNVYVEYCVHSFIFGAKKQKK